jgi:hypothetical protein
MGIFFVIFLSFVDCALVHEIEKERGDRLTAGDGIGRCDVWVGREGAMVSRLESDARDDLPFLTSCHQPLSFLEPPWLFLIYFFI